MVNETIRKSLADIYSDEELLLFDNPSFDNSIIGIDEFTNPPRIVYDYYKMVEEYSAENNCEAIEAMDFIDYNTIRSLPYFENAPIIKKTSKIYGSL